MRRRRLLGLDDLKITSNWRDYLLALGLVAAITVANLTVLPLFGYSVVGLTELLGVLLIAFFFGRGLPWLPPLPVRYSGTTFLFRPASRLPSAESRTCSW